MQEQRKIPQDSRARADNHTVKKGYRVSLPSRDVTNQTLCGGEYYKLFPVRESLVSDIPARGQENR
jgi:hypothetical protein